MFKDEGVVVMVQPGWDMKMVFRNASSALAASPASLSDHEKPKDISVCVSPFWTRARTVRIRYLPSFSHRRFILFEREH